MASHRIFAAVYDAMNAPLEREILGPRRARLLGGVTGKVLDVGAGTGVNFGHFPAGVEVIAAEPDAAMRAKLAPKLSRAHADVTVSDAAAESLPFADDTFDAVVFTLVLCTVSEPAQALAEARRVLRPDGRLLVLEHVRGSGTLARWQDRVDPVWSRIAAGCHPNRDTRASIEHAGFDFRALEEFAPLPRWVPSRTMLQAEATAT